ncbi:hypothetical protein VSX64_14480 [Aurantimonas sp. C2-6-R+9]|uniref:hypothetical protein n=1 Tax=unclassified Aurantimonas TaxID=2638230 RepID=UPI002E18C524|nr:MULTISPECIES: hypothetical protein [unclassified Aurantimonas]MEC5291962.1 hypothetical protein [Aurantimonas sp. C2-3-R2]MEC5382074.1 hypothetical protein [Aurantimonas sp. C2-6-R+9]MEC5413048.1 hypothetical protein [Aurantimonas sp. C2-4-R8]
MDIRLILQVTAAAFVGGVAAHWLDNDALKSAASEIVATLSIVNAAIFPTVVLSATVLRPATVSSANVAIYRKALKRQIAFFFGVFVLSLWTIAVVIFAQVMDWTLYVEVPWTKIAFDAGWIFNLAIVGLGTLVFLRLPAFLQALMSLLDVHINTVAEEAKARETRRSEDLARELSALPSISDHQRAPRPLTTA